jgi:hypothetical protein
MGFPWLVVAFATASSAPTDLRVYRCLDNTMFTLSVTPTQAVVRFADGQYRLPRRQSAIAIKYATPTATLYLDGDFAAFVAEDRPLPGCIRVRPGKAESP